MIKKGTRLKIILDKVGPSPWTILPENKRVFVCIKDSSNNDVDAVIEKIYRPYYNKEYYWNHFTVPNIIIFGSSDHYEILSKVPEQLELF